MSAWAHANTTSTVPSRWYVHRHAVTTALVPVPPRYPYVGACDYGGSWLSSDACTLFMIWHLLSPAPSGSADDESALRDLFSAYVQAKQDWYRGIIEALNAGQSAADSFAPVERFLADRTNRLRAGHFMEEKPGDLWTHQAAAEATSWHRRHADKDIPPLLKQAIRLDPFIIIRRG